MICLINKKRLLSFDPEFKTYKGFRVGDIIAIPEEQTGHHFNNLAVVTGFNPPFSIIHWKAKTIYGGVSHSGTEIKDIIEHYKRQR